MYCVHNSVQATSRYFSAFFRPGRGVLDPTRSGVSSQQTAYANVISVRIRWSTSSSSPAARVSMPCTNPTDGAAPVSDSNNCTQRCAGTKCTTMRYTAHACRFGPYPMLDDSLGEDERGRVRRSR